MDEDKKQNKRPLIKLGLSDVEIFLIDRLNSKVTNVEPIEQGEWSQAFFFQEGDKNKVIRFSPTDEDFKKDQYAFRFTSLNLLIPKIEEIGQAFGGYFAISPKGDGKMIDNLDSTEMAGVFPELMKLFDSLRTIDISQTTGYGGWNFQGNGARKSWKEQIINVVLDDPSSRVNWREKLIRNHDVYLIFKRTYQEILKLVDYCPEDRHVIHNDLLHFNLLVNDNKIAGVIDWGCSLYGDFLYDLAMFILWQFYYPSMKGINFADEAKKYFATKGIDLPNFEQRLKCYQLHLALDAIKFCAYKENQKHLNLITGRVKEII